MDEVLQLQPYFPQWQAKGIKAVLIAQEREPVTLFLQKHKLNILALLDARGEAAAAYGVFAIPQTVWIDKNGTVRHVSVGWREENVAEFDKLADTLSR